MFDHDRQPETVAGWNEKPRPGDEIGEVAQHHAVRLTAVVPGEMVCQRSQQQVDALRDKQFLRQNGQHVFLVPSEVDSFSILKGLWRLEVHRRWSVAPERLAVLLIAAF